MKLLLNMIGEGPNEKKRSHNTRFEYRFISLFSGNLGVKHQHG